MRTITRYHTSAGGVLYDPRAKKIALIHFPPNPEHSEAFALPKGHLEPGETPRQAASREVTEETGYTDIAAGKKIGTIRFTYEHFQRKGEWNHKVVHFFVFLLKSHAIDHALRERYERHSVVWKTFDQAAKMVKYKNARRIIQRAQSLLSKSPRSRRYESGKGKPEPAFPTLTSPCLS